MSRGVVYLVSVVLLVSAVTTVPMPLVETAPGGVTSVAPLVDISGTATTPIDGDLSLLTVFLRQPTLFGALQAWTSPVREVEMRDQVIPTGIGREEYFTLQRRQFARSFEIAAAVGARAAGRDVTLGTAAYVVQVLPGGPSDGILEAGDLFVAVDGDQVDGGEELVELVRRADAGEEIDVTVERGGKTLALTVTAGRVAGMEAPGLGVLVETVAGDIELPFEAELEETRIGGPSAGMMVALTVFDLLSDVDLAGGRMIAGTGTISAEGTVGPIGGIEEKAVAAQRDGVEVLLVPATQLDETLRVTGSDLEVLGVSDIDQAVAALTRGR